MVKILSMYIMNKISYSTRYVQSPCCPKYSYLFYIPIFLHTYIHMIHIHALRLKGNYHTVYTNKDLSIHTTNDLHSSIGMHIDTSIGR